MIRARAILYAAGGATNQEKPSIQARHRCHSTRGVATVDGKRRTVSGWVVGAPRAHGLASGSSYKQYVAAASSPGPKASVWVGWLDDNGRIIVRRSNGQASAFGASVVLNGPRDGSLSGLDLNSQADRVDLIARVQHASGTVGLEHTQTFPGLTLLAAGGKRASFRVLDAGDPVKDATVTVAGQSDTTSADGRVIITVEKPGRYIARATAPKYVGATARVTVRPAAVGPADWSVLTAQGSITAGATAGDQSQSVGHAEHLRVSARVLFMRRERGGAWRRPVSRSKTGRSRRAARQRVMGRMARLKTLVRRADPLGRATQPTDGALQGHAHLRASDLGPPACPRLGGRELDSRRMSDARGRPRDVNRCEGRRTEQADDEREWEKAPAGEIHDLSGRLNWPEG